MKKKIFSILMCLCLVFGFSAMLFVGTAAEEGDAWDGKAASAFDGGTGTKADPYQIATAAQLVLMSDKINDGTGNAAHYKLTADIVFNADMEDPQYAYTPAGGEYPFAGSFDGDKHTISGLYIPWSGKYGAAMFASVTNATIKNFALLNLIVNHTGTTSDSPQTGGVVSFITADSTTGTTIDSVYVQGDVKGCGQNVGGVVGLFSSSSKNTLITNCVFEGNVEAKGNYSGGIVGNGNGGGSVISNCLNLGVITGTSYKCGIIGCSNSNCIVRNCIHIGNGAKYGIGRSVTKDPVVPEKQIKLENCYYTNAISSPYSNETNVVLLENKDALVGTEATICPDGFSRRANDVIIPTTLLDFAPAYLSRSATVTWKNGDTVLATETYQVGDIPTYKGEMPTKAEDDRFTYTFNGWSPEVKELTGDIVYEAEFFRTKKTSEGDDNTGDANTGKDNFAETTGPDASTTAAPEEKKGGCKSAVGGTALVMLVVTGSALAVTTRKKKD